MRQMAQIKDIRPNHNFLDYQIQSLHPRVQVCFFGEGVANFTDLGPCLGMSYNIYYQAGHYWICLLCSAISAFSLACNQPDKLLIFCSRILVSILDLKNQKKIVNRFFANFFNSLNLMDFAG